MKYYLIAGETSGDLHGSNLIKALKNEDVAASFHFVGGDQMQKGAGQTSLIHSAEIAVNGIGGVNKKIRKNRKNLKLSKTDNYQKEPDNFNLIDFPRFNLQIAQFSKKIGIRVCYYISPKIWAWN